MFKQPIPTTVFLALAALSSIFPTGGMAQTNHMVRPLKVGELMGKRVENSDGVELGTVRNLILDAHTGRLKYVVLGSGGFLGVGTKLKVVPPQVLSAATAKRETLAIAVTRQRWQQAPAFSSRQLPTLAQSERANQIARFYDQPDGDIRVAHNTPPEKGLTPTGAHSGNSSVAPELKFASDFIGQQVINRDGEKIGEVLDVLVSFDDHPAFAIVSVGRLFRRREHQYAVPLRAFTWANAHDKLILNAERTTLQKSPPFAPDAWESGVENQIYIYGSGGQHTAVHSLRDSLEQKRQPTKEKEDYGKMQFIGKSAA